MVWQLYMLFVVVDMSQFNENDNDTFGKDPFQMKTLTQTCDQTVGQHLHGTGTVYISCTPIPNKQINPDNYCLLAK